MPNAGWKNLKRTAGPGRPPGRLNNATIEVKEACAKLVDDPIYRERLKARLIAGKLPPAVETMLWFYAKGKPKEQIEINVPDPVTVINKFHGVSAPMEKSDG
jgi:hypothetical protein